MDSKLLVERPLNLLKPISIKNRILLGPGPSNVHPRVADVIRNSSDITHADPQLFEVLEEIKFGLRYIFQTKNEATFVITGSGHTGMECAIGNILEEGDTFASAVSGLWGERAAEMGRKLKCKVVTMNPPRIGQGFKLEDFETILKESRPKLLYICHGDSSTGVLQQMEWTRSGQKPSGQCPTGHISPERRKTLGQLCHEYNCLLLVDAVASLLSTPLNVDDLGVDIIFSGSQKCLNVPPGLALISFSDRAMSVIQNRKSLVTSYYLDVMKMTSAWGIRHSGQLKTAGQRPTYLYHSTHAVSLLIGLREAISIVVETGLAEVIKKHQDTSRFLQEGLTKRGLKLFVTDPNLRLPSVTVVNVPVGHDEMSIRKDLVAKYNIEISGGLGPTAGQVWRIGLMGQNATFELVTNFLDALKEILLSHKSKL